MRVLVLSLMILGLAACSGPAAYRNGVGPVAQFDLGSEDEALPFGARPWRFSVLATGPFEERAMRYRLMYADPARVREYAQSRWAGLPGELLERRLETRLFWPMGEPASRCVTTLELRRFEQVFETPAESAGVLALRAQLRQPGGGVVDERFFSTRRAAAQPDAGGGVRALAEAADAMAQQLLDWQREGRAAGQHRSCWE